MQQEDLKMESMAELVDEYNYLIERIADIDDRIEEMENRIKNALNEDIAYGLRQEKEDLESERRDLEKKLDQVRCNLH